MSTPLVKTASVLTLEGLDRNVAWFSTEPVAGEAIRIVTMDRQTYLDLGSPGEVTATIEVGNTLEEQEIE